MCGCTTRGTPAFRGWRTRGAGLGGLHTSAYPSQRAGCYFCSTIACSRRSASDSTAYSASRCAVTNSVGALGLSKPSWLNRRLIAAQPPCTAPPAHLRGMDELGQGSADRSVPPPVPPAHLPGEPLRRPPAEPPRRIPRARHRSPGRADARPRYLAVGRHFVLRGQFLKADGAPGCHAPSDSLRPRGHDEPESGVTPTRA